MTSPFEQVSDDLAANIRGLEVARQVVLFAAAARALRTDYRVWETASSLPTNLDLLDRAITHAIGYAFGESPVIDADVLRDVENATPTGPDDIPGYTAAQDCWIAVDTSLRCGLGGFDAGDSAWYLLEPILQATCERLFGVADPGSEFEIEAESEALRDTALSAAVKALVDSVDILRSARLEPRIVDEVAQRLLAIAP